MDLDIQDYTSLIFGTHCIFIVQKRSTIIIIVRPSPWGRITQGTPSVCLSSSGSTQEQKIVVSWNLISRNKCNSHRNAILWSKCLRQDQQTGGRKGRILFNSTYLSEWGLGLFLANYVKYLCNWRKKTID